MKGIIHTLKRDQYTLAVVARYRIVNESIIISSKNPIETLSNTIFHERFHTLFLSVLRTVLISAFFSRKLSDQHNKTFERPSFIEKQIV